MIEKNRKVCSFDGLIDSIVVGFGCSMGNFLLVLVKEFGEDTA